MPSRSPLASVDNLGLIQGPQKNESFSKGKGAMGFISYLNSLKHKISPHEDNVSTNKSGSQTIREKGALSSAILVRGDNKLNNTKGISRHIDSCKSVTISL
jgi:hypothetical protein